MSSVQAKRIERVTRGLTGEVVIPGDKSISHRSVILAGLAEGPTEIVHWLEAADCLSTLEGMKRLGAGITHRGEGMLTVHGVGWNNLRELESVLDAGNSGTMLRLLLGALAPQPFLTTFMGDASLSRRPMGRVIQPLTQMGAKIVGRKGNTLLPITLLPAKKSLRGIRYEMPVASAQVKSALLLAGIQAEGETTVVEPLMSRDHTERLLDIFGVPIKCTRGQVTVQRASLHAPERIEVPGDISSAAYWLVAATLIPGSDLLLKNVGINPTRTGILDVMKAMGADITLLAEHISGNEPVADIRVKAAPLRGVSFGASLIPRLIDEIPVIVAAALLAEGDTIITGAGELRVKETDRLQAMAEEYNKLAPGSLTELSDGLVIHGQSALRFAAVSSRADHRIAMALAVAGAAGDGVEIRDPDCVDISYPNFYQTLEALRK